MEILVTLSIAFGSFCYQMADSIQPQLCELSCQCADAQCEYFELRIDHEIGQSAIIKRRGEHRIDVTVDGINQEKSYKLEDAGQDLRVWKELHGQKIKAVRYRTAKTQIFCSARD